MIKQFFLFTLIFSLVICSSPSFAQWVKVGQNDSGYTYYINFKTIKKKNGFVYYWVISDYLKPDKWKDMSSKTLYEADCKYPKKERKIYATYHTQPFAKGEPSTVSPDTRDWYYPSPNSVMELMLEKVCNY